MEISSNFVPNYLTKFRVGIEQTGDFAATSENYLITDKDQATAKDGGKFAAYSFTNIEQKLVDSFYTAVANALVFDKTTMNENNHRSFIMIDDSFLCAY